MTSTGFPVRTKGAYSSTMIARAFASLVPTTTRSGFRKSSTAVPSFRNSGLETTATGWRVTPAMTSSTRPAVPTGTVDLLTTTL